MSTAYHIPFAVIKLTHTGNGCIRYRAETRLFSSDWFENSDDAIKDLHSWFQTSVPILAIIEDIERQQSQPNWTAFDESVRIHGFIIEYAYEVCFRDVMTIVR